MFPHSFVPGFLLPGFLLFAAAPALASPISAPATIGGPDSGAATPDPAAVFYNPGAIGATEGVKILVDVQLSKIDVEATATRNDGIDPNTGEPYDVSTAHVLVPVGILGVSWKATDWLAVGFAATDAFVGGGDYSSSEDNPPPYTSHQRYAGVTTQLITIALMPAVAITPIEGVHVGGGFDYVIDKVELLKTSDPLGTEGLGIEPYSTDVILSGDASGSHTMWNAGVFFDRFELAQLGVSYTSESVLHAEGDATLSAPALISSTAEPIDIDGKFTFDLPLASILRVAAASQVNEKLRLGASYDLFLWNKCCGGPEGDAHIVLQNAEGNPIGADDGLAIDVDEDIYSPRRLWNAAGVSVNGGWQATPKFWFGGRAEHKQFAVPDYAVSATNLSFESYGLSAAVRYRIAKPVSIGVAYTKNFLLTREITNSAWDVRDEDSEDYKDERFSAEGPFGASTNGTYSGKSNVFGFRLNVDL